MSIFAIAGGFGAEVEFIGLIPYRDALTDEIRLKLEASLGGKIDYIELSKRCSDNIIDELMQYVKKTYN